MGKDSKIEWCDATWNPWRGCKKVSPGCKNCYMFSGQKRRGWNPDVVVRSKTTFNDPLKWKDARMIFTCSWSDWFIKEADEWRAEAWEIIRKTPQHTYQILTKRPERIKECLPADWGDGYPNVWLGVSVEDQKTADVRIPILLDVPAKIRFLSAEPLLGPLDLSKWMLQIPPFPLNDSTPKDWDQVTWPDWVPVKVIKQIEEFWSPDWGRGPKAYILNCLDSYNAKVPFGTRIEMKAIARKDVIEGRWVHAWNNISRLVDDEGGYHVTSTCELPDGYKDPRKIHWVIAGGESGSKAATFGREMNPEWARSIRDQCVNAQVPFFFKQWGGMHGKMPEPMLDGEYWNEVPGKSMKWLETGEMIGS